jgi:chromosome segregation ATPase
MPDRAEVERLVMQHENLSRECLGQYELMSAEVERLKEEMAEWESAHMAVAELRGLVESHMDTARGQWECVDQLAQARADTDDLVAKAWDAAKAGIDQLTQERDQARAERDERDETIQTLRFGIEVGDRRYVELGVEIDQLRAENQALREVVEVARRVTRSVANPRDAIRFEELVALRHALAALDGQAPRGGSSGGKSDV